MKKLMSMLLVAFIAIGLAVPAFADGAITGDEQRILDELNKGVNAGGTQLAVPGAEMAKAENHLKANDVSPAAVNTVVENIAAARSLIEAQGVSAGSMEELMKKLPASVVAQLKQYITNAANALGLKVRFTANGVEIIGQNGQVVMQPTTSSNPVIKTTGANYSVSLVAFASLMIAAMGAAVVGKKYAFA